MAITYSPFAPFANLVIFEYMDTTTIGCRIRGIYSLMLRGNFSKAAWNINEVIINLRRAKEIDMDSATYNKIFDEFCHMRILFATKKYNDAHNRLRDLHYMLNFDVVEQSEDELSMDNYDEECPMWYNYY